MPVGLIIPPSLILSDERFFTHIGVLRVAAVLREKKIEVDVLDLSGVANYPEAVCAYIAGKNKPWFIGITATSPQMPATARIAEIIRNFNPDIKLVLGGPHVTLVNAARRQEVERNVLGRADHDLQRLAQMFDCLVAGDGEKAIFEALNPNGPQLIDADDRRSPLFLTSEELTALPFPARDLVAMESYHYRINGAPATSMIAQLGCPFQCGFCGGRESPFLRKVRVRTTESVIAEMRHIYQTYGYRGIMFYDDELNVNPQMVALMRAIATLGKELGIEWALRGFIKSELFTDEQAEAMYEAGFREILTGFESGSPRILRNIKKGATREDNTRCVEIARRHGLRVKALMSVGHPGETEETILETKDWILAMRPESFDLTRITVYPGTPYFDHAVPHLDGVWVYTVNGDHLYSRQVDYFKDFIYYKGDRGARMGLDSFFAFTDELSAEDLARLCRETERELREKLGQPYQTDVPELQFGHSMGQGLPDFILRSSTAPT